MNTINAELIYGTLFNGYAVWLDVDKDTDAMNRVADHISDTITLPVIPGDPTEAEMNIALDTCRKECQAAGIDVTVTYHFDTTTT